MSNSNARSADEQCRDYVERKRLIERRRAADRAALKCLVDLQSRYGSELTVGAWVRLTGLILISGPNKRFIQASCRFLAKYIAISVWRRMLTRRPMLH
jgi:hypothetical protein